MVAAKAGAGKHNMVRTQPKEFELPEGFTKTEVGNKIQILLTSENHGIEIPKEHFPSVAVAMMAFASGPRTATAAPAADAPPAEAPKAASRTKESAKKATAATKPAAKPSTRKKAAAAAATAPDEEDPNWFEKLPKEQAISDNIQLEMTTVEIDEKRADRVVGKAKKTSKRTSPAYDIKVGGKHAGYVLVSSSKRFVIVAPDLKADRTVHRGFDPTIQRIEMLVKYAS